VRGVVAQQLQRVLVGLVTISSLASVVIGRVRSRSSPFSFTARAALARPGPMAAATSAPVTGLANWRWLPSGSVIVGMVSST
jgi:hypothetical protein